MCHLVFSIINQQPVLVRLIVVFVPLEECCRPSRSCHLCLVHPNSSAGAGQWWSPQHHYWHAGHTQSPRGPCLETWSWSHPWPGWTPTVGRATEKTYTVASELIMFFASHCSFGSFKNFDLLHGSSRNSREYETHTHLSRRLAVIELGSSITVSPRAVIAIAAGAAPKQAGHHLQLWNRAFSSPAHSPSDHTPLELLPPLTTPLLSCHGICTVR